jgi:hypothetical protein
MDKGPRHIANHTGFFGRFSLSSQGFAKDIILVYDFPIHIATLGVSCPILSPIFLSHIVLKGFIFLPVDNFPFLR